MKYEIEKVIDGILKYIDNEIYSNMNDWQEFIARVFIGRFINNEDNVKEMLLNNGFIRTFGIIDSDGKIDVNSLIHDIKRELERKGEISFNIPMFGRMKFIPADADALYKTITGEMLQ